MNLCPVLDRTGQMALVLLMLGIVKTMLKVIPTLVLISTLTARWVISF
jgi:hypothetical protein